MARVYNFSSGPAMLPEEVLIQAQNELLDYRGSGMSVMEMSHRSAVFMDIMDRAFDSLRRLMSVPEDYEILFLQGGATSQFSMVPLNLFRKSRKADFVITGNWSKKAIQEASRYGECRAVASSEADGFTWFPDLSGEMFDPEADFVHLTTNNTIYGTRITRIPDTGDIPLVADMSSNILSEPYKVEDFGLIYAGAQKNIGPAGLTIVIIRKDLLGHADKMTPLMFNYQTHAAKKSAYNTPPCFAIYMAGLVFDWILEQGGVEAMEKHNQEKAGLLYDCLDSTDFYVAPVRKKDRSLMNIPFRLKDESLTAGFLAEADALGMKTLKGYRTVGGVRASIYNPMPLKGVESLVEFMKDFEQRH